MELNPENKQEIMNMLAHYSKVMRLENVQVVFERKQGNHKYSTNGILGEAYRGSNTIFLNLPQFVEMYGLHGKSKPFKKRTRTYTKKIGHLEETLIHELVHLKHTTLRHGKAFEEKVRFYFRVYRYKYIEVVRKIPEGNIVVPISQRKCWCNCHLKYVTSKMCSGCFKFHNKME
jgi:hypothetical protein